MGDKKVKIAFAGLGGRGTGLLGLTLDMGDIEVTAVCDPYPDRAERAAKMVADKGGSAKAYNDHSQMIREADFDGIVVPSSWQTHIPIAVEALRAGKYVGMEVGGATSVRQCWDLVRASEESGMPCMLLENCCYGREEMAVLNMVKLGLFGEIIHCQGGYEHDLRDEVALGLENRHYRHLHYKDRNGELYPTHELGPIAKVLEINRGNRMLSLTAMASKSRGIGEWIRTNRPDDAGLNGTVFEQGDVVTTMIKCAHGETILLVHDTSLPRPYSRGGRVQGTKGIWLEDKNAVSIEGFSAPSESWDHHSWTPMEEVFEKYEHPLWKEYRALGIKAGHGGMDYLVLRGYFESIRDRTQTPIDVYDTAAWMAVTCLSEDSIAMGSLPVAVPDFTDGRWLRREDSPAGKYALDRVCGECFG